MKSTRTRGSRATTTEKEALKPVDDRKVGKRKAASTATKPKVDKSNKRQTKKEKLAKKDPNKPKRPPTAFFVFLEEFRRTFKTENPDVKAVSAVGKAGGQKWKSMSQAEKAPYEAKAAEMKAEYQKEMNTYNTKQESEDDVVNEEPKRSKPEVNGEDKEDSAEDEEEEEEEDEEEEDEDED